MLSLNDFRRWVRRYPAYLFGRAPRLHRIPFGPLRGQKLFMAWDISPRMWLGIDEPWVARLAAELISPGATVYDIGAHIGYTTLLFAKQVGAAGTVHAFEILPSVAEGFLRKSVEANDLHQVHIHAIGISDAPVEVELAAGPTLMANYKPAAMQPERMEQCRAARLDDLREELALGAPALIKMDVERSDVAALEGSLETLRTHRPALIVEFHSVDRLRRGLALLDALDYRFETEQGPLTSADAARMTQFHASVLCRPAL